MLDLESAKGRIDLFNCKHVAIIDQVKSVITEDQREAIDLIVQLLEELDQEEWNDGEEEEEEDEDAEEATEWAGEFLIAHVS